MVKGVGIGWTGAGGGLGWAKKGKFQTLRRNVEDEQIGS